MFHLIGFIVFGFIVGLIARAIMPGRQHMTMTATTVLGILGSLLAGYTGRFMGWYTDRSTGGFIASTLGAIIVLAIYHGVMSRRAQKQGLLQQNSDSRNYPRKAA